MKRIRLDVGALSASSQDSGTFMFFLYKQEFNKCMPVNLTPNEMHTLLVNFNKIPSEAKTIHNVFHRTLREYRIEMLETTIIRDHKANNFLSEILVFDGEKEFIISASFVDGIIMAREFGIPIYTSQATLDKYGVSIDDYSDKAFKAQDKLNRYKKLLQKFIENEDYENAARISEQIDLLSKGEQNE